VNVPVSELRAHLSDWLARVQEGDEIVVTDRGVPVARIVGVDAESTLERLTREGAISRPLREKRPMAPPRVPNRSGRLVSDFVSEQRR
jgi:prevent-host-death family protein